RLAFELLVIFVGITAAFAAENYRESIERRARARQFYRAILGELDVFIGPAGAIADTMTARLARFASDSAAGRRVAPPYFREPGGERPPSAVWDAAVTSGAFTYLRPELYFQLARVYNHIRSIGDRYQRYNGFTEQTLLPALATPDNFYVGGALRGDVRGHVGRLAELRDELRTAAASARVTRDSVRAELSRLD
ncbi:MAG TPA: hypothetical protein VEA99_14255, partial [Gemmatimonadaceae bacterium]|nr:hypothetical protein [Gemmatimonadaceae bacterium]